MRMFDAEIQSLQSSDPLRSIVQVNAMGVSILIKEDTIYTAFNVRVVAGKCSSAT